MVPSSHEINLAHVPARDSSNVNKRTTAPSPLSRPVTMGADSSPMSPPVRSNTEGPNSAAERLAALSADPKRGLKNRLRRAFSFGSAAELRKAAAGNSTDVAERTRLRQERYREEQEAEQRRVAEQQEASGLGEGIYNGQGHFFTGSTDNISVSSTASSASIMIRKMGKGMKKSTRSLVGLFRPKSITGVEAASGPVATGPSAAQVTMLTVEAEREKVNVNLDPHDHVGGGTGFPKLARNSIDAASVNAVSPAPANESSGSGGRLDDAGPRKSTIGGEKERAEILAVVKKGILKRLSCHLLVPILGVLLTKNPL